MCINIFSYWFTQIEGSARSLHVHYFWIVEKEFVIVMI